MFIWISKENQPPKTCLITYQQNFSKAGRWIWQDPFPLFEVQSQQNLVAETSIKKIFNVGGPFTLNLISEFHLSKYVEMKI